MPDRTWITVFFPTPLIFRYHLPLSKGGKDTVHTVVFIGNKSQIENISLNMEIMDILYRFLQ